MAKKHRPPDEAEGSDETEVGTSPDFPEELPVGLKELPAADGGSKTSQMEAALKDGWERRVEEDKDALAKGKKVEQWINRRDFNTSDGVVPQGVIRPLEEAYALECKRYG